MVQITYSDYFQANYGIALAGFFLAVLGAFLSGLWAFTKTREAGLICILLTALSGATGLLAFWTVAAWVVLSFGLYEFEDPYTGPFPWPPVVIWFGGLVLSYAMSRLHAYSVTAATGDYELPSSARTAKDKLNRGKP